MKNDDLDLYTLRIQGKRACFLRKYIQLKKNKSHLLLPLRINGPRSCNYFKPAPVNLISHGRSDEHELKTPRCVSQLTHNTWNKALHLVFTVKFLKARQAFLGPHKVPALELRTAKNLNFWDVFEILGGFSPPRPLTFGCAGEDPHPGTSLEMW